MNKQSKVLIGLLLTGILLSIGATYYRYMVRQDFIVVTPPEETLPNPEV